MKDNKEYTIVEDFENHPLVQAIKNGDLNSVQEAIERGENVNISANTSTQGHTLLGRAILNANESIEAEILLVQTQFSLVFNLSLHDSFKVMYNIMQNNKISDGKEYIKKAIETEIQKRNLKASSDHIDQLCQSIAQALASKGADARQNSIEIVEVLLKAGLKVTDQDIHDVIQGHNFKIMKLMLSTGVHPTKILYNYIKIVKPGKNFNIGEIEVIQDLISRGANINNSLIIREIIQQILNPFISLAAYIEKGMKLQKIFETFLTLSFSDNKDEILWAQFFLKHHNQIDFKATNSEKETLLHKLCIAPTTNDLKTMVHFLRIEIDIDAKNSDGNTALHLAIKRELYDYAAILITNGAKLDITNNRGETAKDLLAKINAKQLLEAGIEVTRDRSNKITKDPLSFIDKIVNMIKALLDTLLGKEEKIEVRLTTKSKEQNIVSTSTIEEPPYKKDEPTLPSKSEISEKTKTATDNKSLQP